MRKYLIIPCILIIAALCVTVWSKTYLDGEAQLDPGAASLADVIARDVVATNAAIIVSTNLAEIAATAADIVATNGINNSFLNAQHTDAFLKTGARPMTGDADIGGFDVENVDVLRFSTNSALDAPVANKWNLLATDLRLYFISPDGSVTNFME